MHGPKMGRSSSNADFNVSVLNYILYEKKISEVSFRENVSNYNLYGYPLPELYTEIVSLFAKKNNEQKDIDISEWEKFKVSSLFRKSERPAKRSKLNYDDGDIPFIASGNFNNGIEKFVTPKENEIFEKGGCLTVSPLDGSTFFQPIDFLGRGGAGSSIIILRPRDIILNKYTALFLCTVLRIVLRKFQYADMVNGENIQNENLYLPLKDGHPDWSFMENYIKSLPYSADL